MRRRGGCFVCDKPCFESRTVYPQEHPRAGQPRSGLVVNPAARRAQLLLAASGHTAMVTICETCEIAPEALPALWRRAVANGALELDRDYRRSMGMKPLSPAEEVEKRDHFHLMLYDVPIGALGSEAWSDYLARIE